MARWIFSVCLVLTLSKLCRFDSPDEIECPPEALIASNFDGPENETNSTCACKERWCLPLCCPKGLFLIDSARCETIENKTSPKLPPYYEHPTEDKEALPGQLRHDHFHEFSWNPCQGGANYTLDPETKKSDEFKLLTNGSIYLPPVTDEPETIIHYNEYCFAALVDKSVYKVLRCFTEPAFETYDEDDENGLGSGNDEGVETELPNFSNEDMPLSANYIHYLLIVSLPFLFVTFVVYSIIPELRNMHGSTLRAYVGVSIIRDIHRITVLLVEVKDINHNVCIILAHGMNFSSLAGFFWLNVMCFDIWWTFGGFRSIQSSMNRRGQKKFIIYSVYAWGSASFFTGICLIMDLAPFVPRNWIRPRFGELSCWYFSPAAQTIYFYTPVGSTLLCNICLFVLTALKIIQHKKTMAHDLKGMDSRRHDVSKQWFNLYLKLFAVMGISWSMEILDWILKNDTPEEIWIFTNVFNSLQGVVIFVIFVCTRKIQRLVLKRFGCWDQQFKGRNSTKSSYRSTTSRTSSYTTSVMAPLQESKEHYSARMQITTDDSDYA